MYVPDRLVLQFHITERCNLRCGHCYQEGSPAVDPSWDQLVSVIEQYKQLLDYWQGITGKAIPGHVNLTGGEVFLRRDFFDFLAFLNDQSNYFSHAILTNGLLCTSEVCSRLQKLKPKFVQISLDGSVEIQKLCRIPNRKFPGKEECLWPHSSLPGNGGNEWYSYVFPLREASARVLCVYPLLVPHRVGHP